MEKFAFLVHPLSLKDVENFEKGARGRSPQLVEKVLEWTPPFKLSHITGIRSTTGVEAEGWFVSVPLLPHQILNLNQESVIEKIVKACQIAEKLGAKIIGLGAFTAMIGNGGQEIADQIEIAVTTGNTYTTALAIEATRAASATMNLKLDEAILAVIGATGSIGSACAQIMASEVGKLLLVGRNKPRLATVAQKIKGNGLNSVEVSTNISRSVHQADIIIAVSGAIDCIIHPKDIKPGAVVCDVARPRDVSRQVAEVRDDVLVIDGGIVEVPGQVEFNLDFGPPKGMAEGCVAETIVLALEKRYEDYTIGRKITPEMVQEMRELAAKHGFKLAAFRRFEKAISSEKIAAIRRNALAHRLGSRVDSAQSANL